MIKNLLASIKFGALVRAIRLFVITFVGILLANASSGKAAIIAAVVAAAEQAWRTAFKTQPVAGRKTAL